MTTGASGRLAGIKILLVDDDLLSIKLIIAALDGEGSFIQSASNAADALTLLRADAPRLVVLDLALPDMSGLELAKLIRSTPGCRDTVILAVSSRNGRETEREALNAGCAAFLRKPIDALSLAEVLVGLLHD